MALANAELKTWIFQPFLSFRGVAAVSLAAVVMLVLACISVLLDSRLELVHRADLMARNILVLADQTVEIEVGRYDTRLLDVISDLHAVGDGAMPANEELFGGAALRNSIGDIVVLDARGSVLASSRPGLTKDYEAALPGILAQARSGPSGLAMSTLVLPGGAQPMIALSRRCPAGACGAAAVVVAMLPMSWIQGVLNGLELGPKGVIGLIDTRGVLLAREPPAPWKIGQPVETEAIIAKIVRGRTFVYLKRSSTDGVRRRMTGGRVAGLPLLVVVGVSVADVLSGWVNLAAVTIFAVVVLSGGLVALTFLLAQQVRGKMKVDEELLQANAQLADLARTDALTGLLNRRGFDENLAREWRRCRRAGKLVSLLMLDADHFKMYNDHFGHQAGDAVLRRLGGCILSQIRQPGDIAARYGGEEFSVVLPDTDLAAGVVIAEAIRTSIEELGIPCWPDGCVTISIGLCCAGPGPHGTAEELVAAADAALYESKAKGRNRVTGRRLIPQPAAEQARA